jgi:hypothetical protein
MGDPTSDPHPPRRRHDVLEIPIVWVALVLSLLLHVGALWLWLPSLLDHAHNARFGDGSQIVADLRPAAPPSAPPPAPPVIVPPVPPPVIAPPVPAPSPTPPPPKRTPAPKVARPKAAPAPSAPPPPPMVAERAPVAIPTPEPSPPEPAAVPNSRSATAAPRESDLSAYIEARRRARGEAPSEPSAPAPAAPETDRERLNRMVASNLGLNRTPSFGYDPERAGGMFQITSLEYDYADFWFFGLNKAINRNTKQKIVVRKGDESDIRIAVVRKMIAIIRDHVSGDFTWISRAGAVTMSARPSENAALEAFIMRDIFPEYRYQ